jgi:HSP20 family protein
MTLLGQAHREEKSSTKATHRATNHAVGLSYQRFCPSEAWTPAVNLYEDPEAYYLVMDLAGVKTNQIDVRVDNKGVMVITGTREMPELTGAGNTVRLHLMEIDHGRFCRTVDLPEDTDVDSIDATYRCGYLWVRVSKK